MEKINCTTIPASKSKSRAYKGKLYPYSTTVRKLAPDTKAIKTALNATKNGVNPSFYDHADSLKHFQKKHSVPKALELAVKWQGHSRNPEVEVCKTTEPKGNILVHETESVGREEDVIFSKYGKKAKALLEDPERTPEEVGRVFEEFFEDLSGSLPTFSPLFDYMKVLAAKVRNSQPSMADETTTESEGPTFPQIVRRFGTKKGKSTKRRKAIRLGKSSTQELAEEATTFHNKISRGLKQRIEYVTINHC
eukprot:TRINITY_DN70837_c0_g1_i1.p1 TRINITY_DN70837_c0_g1~~TRINITY_DN70837_c0_g1_i1.p1  ORF type:complete len:250 (+),score=19.44 TRINITY_DN70837_c0_g1_i1:340-1089(+)